MSNPITNDRFLQTLFRHKTPAEQIFTASVPGDPTSSRSYGFQPFLDPTANNFFCVSTLSDPSNRTPSNCQALYVLVVDDVVQKIPTAKVLGILGEPSYVLETSEGSCQWGYLLDPPARNQSVAEGLVRGLAACFTGDMAGRNRLARLPIGRNGKPGKNNHPAALLQWRPNLSLTPAGALAMLEAQPVPIADLTPQPFLPPDRDPVLLALPAYDHTRIPGTYKITCPWVEEHTEQRDDGTVYIAPAGFKCHHGHCHNRTFADLRKHLGLTASEVDDAIVEAGLTNVGAELTNVPALVDKEPPIEEDQSPPEQMLVEEKQILAHPWSSSTVGDLFHADGTPLSRDELAKLYPRKWLFQSTIPMGVPWGIAGEGGLGKSRLGLALCMSIASGVPLGDDLVPAIEEGAPAVFLTQEDGKPDRAWRFITQLEYMAQHDPRWRDPVVLERLRRNLYIPQLPFGQTLSPKFRKLANEVVRTIGAVRLFIFDPLILFWDHSDDKSNINSANGTITTFGYMIDCARHPDRKEDDEWSAGILHHLGKSGEVYGSAMIQAHLRVLFGLTRPEGGTSLELEVQKVNGSNIMGRKYGFSMEPITGAVYPERLMPSLSDHEKVARALHSGLLDPNLAPKALIKAAAKLEFLGADPGKTVKRVLDDWESELPEHLGLTREPYGKYKPIQGFGIKGE